MGEPQPTRTIGMIWRKTSPWPDSSCNFLKWFVGRRVAQAAQSGIGIAQPPEVNGKPPDADL
jgi:hypothetical protein